jgi:hypothetical protein
LPHFLASFLPSFSSGSSHSPALLSLPSFSSLSFPCLLFLLSLKTSPLSCPHFPCLISLVSSSSFSDSSFGLVSFTSS